MTNAVLWSGTVLSKADKMAQYAGSVNNSHRHQWTCRNVPYGRKSAPGRVVSITACLMMAITAPHS